MQTESIPGRVSRLAAGLVSTVVDGLEKKAPEAVAEQAIRETSSLALMGPLADAKAQLAALVPNGFVSATGAAQLPRLRAYLEGLEHRVRRLAENPGRDRVRQSEVEQAIELYREAGGTLPLQADAPARIVKARWLLEELRLSLFAQHIRTTEPASLQRIRKALA